GDVVHVVRAAIDEGAARLAVGRIRGRIRLGVVVVRVDVAAELGMQPVLDVRVLAGDVRRQRVAFGFRNAVGDVEDVVALAAVLDRRGGAGEGAGEVIAGGDEAIRRRSTAEGGRAVDEIGNGRLVGVFAGRLQYRGVAVIVVEARGGVAARAV